MPRHFFLITVDTLRADHLLSVRGGASLSPGLEVWAREAVVAKKNYSVATVTSAGIAGILTGLAPDRSGVLVNDHVLGKEVPVVAQTLSRAGFDTAAFVANPVLGRGFGFERGIEEYELIPKKRPARKARARDVVVRAIRWLDSRSSNQGRLFLWLHFMEPHGPYDPSQAFLTELPLEIFGPAERKVPLLASDDHSGLGGIPGYQQRLDIQPLPVDARIYSRRYAAEIKELDVELSRFLELLSDRGFLSDSLVVLSADHGEALEDDNGFYYSHDHSLTEDQISTPLLMWFPGSGKGTIDSVTSNLDIVPTALEFLDVPAAPEVEHDGFSLVRQTRVGPVFAQTWTERMVQRNQVRMRVDRDSGNERFFTISAEGFPTEVSKVPSDVASVLRADLDRLFERKVFGTPMSRLTPSPEDSEALRALGYVP